MQKFIPSLVWYRPFEPFAYAFIRFWTGAMFVTHGVYRLFYNGSAVELGAWFGQPSAPAVGAFELVGGVMIALGLLTRPIAILFVLEWIAAAFAAPVKPGTAWFLLSAPLHYPAMVTAMCIAIVVRGGGYYSLDRLIGKEF
jgi:putative oxidoreductase